jgi:SEC-C motif domain protein
MRSRYSAYTEQNADYLLATWHPDTRPASLNFESCRWLGLKVRGTKLGTDHDIEGWVSFVARYKVAGKAFRIEENSYFTRINKRWFYVNGGD